MKTLHKLLAGTILVALAAFGLTALTSSSSNSLVPVLAFLNETCSSDVYMEHESIQAMLEFKGTERDGIVWDFESYNHIEDLQTQLYPECHLVSDLLREQEIVVRGTPWPARPSDPYGAQGGGGGGGGGGSRLPTPPAPGTEPAKKLTDEELVKLKNCLQKKLGELGDSLKKIENVRCLGDLNLSFQNTNYTWRTYSRNDGNMGRTIYVNDTNLDVDDYTVTLDPNSIANFVSEFNTTWKRSGRTMNVDNLTTHAALDEVVHTIQGELADWDVPPPYEWHRMQVQANLISHSWYRQLHPGKVPPISTYIDDEINKHRNADCTLKDGEEDFLTKKNEYQALETKEADGTLTNADRDEMEELRGWFRGQLPRTTISGAFTEAELDCD